MQKKMLRQKTKISTVEELIKNKNITFEDLQHLNYQPLPRDIIDFGDGTESDDDEIINKIKNKSP